MASTLVIPRVTASPTERKTMATYRVHVVQQDQANRPPDGEQTFLLEASDRREAISRARQKLEAEGLEGTVDRAVLVPD